MKLKTLDELTELEKLALRPLSYSRINNYDMCASKYFYSYIVKEEQVFGPPAVLGNVLHSVLEHTVGEPLNYAKAIGLMSDYLKKYDPEQKIDEDLRQDGRVMLAEFVDKHRDDTFDVIEREKQFEIIVGSAKILGYIDLVMHGPNNSVMIVDYKTGKREVAQKNAPSDLQLGIYALAMAQEYP
ncbi:MAG: PD-(D/E)XK nuclease family protein, partial [Actinobacteria bacterium]|nr:PD-(D/E)XK nuclease family protein [Actinomycetota bacterium]